MSSYKYLVINYESGNTLGLFNNLENALIFISGYYDKYFNEPNLKLIIIKQESRD